MGLVEQKVSFLDKPSDISECRSMSLTWINMKWNWTQNYGRFICYCTISTVEQLCVMHNFHIFFAFIVEILIKWNHNNVLQALCRSIHKFFPYICVYVWNFLLNMANTLKFKLFGGMCYWTQAFWHFWATPFENLHIYLNLWSKV